MENDKNLYSVSYRLGWLEKEVGILENKIEFYDGLFFKIKGWTVVSWSGLVSYAIKNSEWRIVLFSPLIPLLFMIVEANYKRYQIQLVKRTRYIMRILNDKNDFARWQLMDGTVNFPIYDLLNIYSGENDSDSTGGKWGSILAPLKKASVSLLYWCLIAASFAVMIILICTS